MKELLPGYQLTPLRIAAIYGVVGGLWILFSDSLLAFFADPSVITRLSIGKGWAYVLFTALLLYWLVSRYATEQRKMGRDLIERDNYNLTLYELSPVGLALCRMDGQLVDVNPAYAKIIGRTVDETLKLSYWDITPEKYAAQEAIQVDALERTGRYGPYEKEYFHKDGYLVPVRLSGLIVEREGEKLIWSSVEDITERKQSEEALLRNEQVLRLFIEYSPAAIAMFDKDMKYIVASRRFFVDYNLGEQDIIGRSHYEVFPEVPERWREIHRRCLAGAVEKCEEDPFPRKDGKNDWVRWEIRPWYETQGEIGGIILFSEVITKRKQVEAALRLSEEKFVKTFRNSPDAIALTSLANGQFVEVNESFLRLSGYRLDEIIGRTTLDLHLWVNSEDRQRYIELVQKSGRVTGMEVDFQKKSGEIMRSLVSGELIEVQDSTYILNVIFDITERKNAEMELEKHREHLEELVQERTIALQDSQRALMNIVEDLNLKTEELEVANIKLKELDRLKSMFIASMSHELRTPLNSIIGFSGIMLQGMTGDLNNEQHDQLERVFRAGKHLLSLITDVIDIAKIESGKIVPFPEEFRLDEFIDEVVGQILQQAKNKGLSVEHDIPDKSFMMHADRRRLLQCLLNYLSNAVKFTEKGSIRIIVEEEDGWVRFSVADTGIGIRDEDMDVLFGSFVRLETPLKKIIPGTGLGLYLTKKLAEEVLGGKVSVTSKLGEGSVFVLSVPQKLPESLMEKAV